MRELSTTQFIATQHTDVNLLYKNGLLTPVELKKNLTYLYGKDSDMFPLLTMTEGNGAIVSKTPLKLNDTQYTWKVFGRTKHTSKIVRILDASANPGKGRTVIRAIFEDNIIHVQYSVRTPDGLNRCRIQTEGRRYGVEGYMYEMVLMTGDETTWITNDNFLNGKSWAYGPTSVAATKSDGTHSNSMVPGEWTNQFGFQRYSKEITGNIANKVVNIQLDATDANGNNVTTDMWMPFEMAMFERDMRLMLETDLWESEYNRDQYGVIHLTDPVTNEVIPQGAGIKQALKVVGNYDTYSTLTRSKFDNTIKSVFGNRVDDTPMELVIYTGRGGAEAFHTAIMNDAVLNQYFTPVGEKAVSGNGFLSYGAYFNQYRTIDGKVLTIKVANYFDHGLIAEQQRANSQMFGSYPWESYTMICLDHSRTNDGGRNITLVAEAGREYITGVYKGLTPLPGSWGAIPEGLLSTTKDEAKYEVMISQGISFTNPTTSFMLTFEP
jgi:hypothetical protein